MSKKLRILIVEDEIVLQDVYKLVLSSHGYEVTTANNGAEGLAQLKKVVPDLVLLDVFMPVMDGKEFLRNFDLNDYPHTKIVVYSNLSDSKTEAEMRELGAHDFILKSSMTPQDLIDLVTKK
jgi:CheY-like chemotaxis protein